MNLKSLTFYVGSIGFVVALFSFTTAYGEANLKASTKIEGRYRIAAQNLPGCLKDDEPLVLTIQQSGVYLSGSLLSKDETTQIMTAAKKKPSLSGTWDQQKLDNDGRQKKAFAVGHLGSAKARVVRTSFPFGCLSERGWTGADGENRGHHFTKQPSRENSIGFLISRH